MIDQDLLYRIVGERLRKARRQGSISQSDSAAAIAHLRTSITNIEGGRQRAPLHVLYELCHYLRIQLISILPLEEEVREDSLELVRTGEVVFELPPPAGEGPQLAARQILQQRPGELPLDVNALVQNYGLSILRQAEDRCLIGTLVLDGARPTIMLNSWFDGCQQRFSLAHLFGHFVLHRSSAPLFLDFIRFNEERTPEARRLQEQEANEFAAELLMPEEVLRERFADKPLNVHSGNIVQALAAEFGVSELVFALRLSQLGLTSS